LVVGAGCAGIAAALAAARTGASTMLVERAGFAGGYITGVQGASFDGFVDLRSGLPVVGGIVFELVPLAARTSAPGDYARTRFRFNAEIGQMRGVQDLAYIRFDIERLKLVADRLFRQAGVRVLYHTVVADALCRGTHVDGVVLANKAGLSVVKPRAIVDASGDADVVAFAGGAYEMSDAAMQPMSLHFRIGNVQLTPETRDQCAAVLQRAHAEGKLHQYGGPWMANFDADDYYFNATRIAGNGTRPEDLTRAETQGREDAWLMFEAFKAEVPAFRDSYLVNTGPVAGVRETRRIRGTKTLTAGDIEDRRAQPDVVSLGGWWLDRHPKGGSGYHPHLMVRPYDIAYGTLVPQGLANVWVAGRCHSAESAALASSRVTITCMGMGQAAGTAAAMAVARKEGAHELAVRDLQARLLADGAIILERAEEVRKVGDALGAVSVASASQ
ncbi:MAG: FAD-dependent oxidoreductase, partial [Actinobacteria bacterium]|nr:FAD-dependent oxidoreductase [Actinomycetota bacterium]